MNLFMFRRTPRVLRGGISGTLEFASSRKTPRTSRLALASPVMGCECAMEPIGSFLFSGSSSCLLLQGFGPDLRSHHKEALLVVNEKGRRRVLRNRRVCECCLRIVNGEWVAFGLKCAWACIS